MVSKEDIHYNSNILTQGDGAMPKNIHSNLKPRQLGVIKTENPLNLSPMSCTVPKEHFTAGGRSTVPSKGQTAPTRQRSLMSFQDG